VTAGAAAPLLARFALFEEIVRIENSLADKTRFTADVAMAVNMGLLGSVSARGEVSVIVDDDDVVAEIDMRTRVLNEERVIQSFVSGGYLYTQSEGERTKVRLDAELSDINMEGLLGFSAMDGFALNASYFVTDATRTTQGGRTVFTRYFADSFMNTAMDMVMTIVGVVGLDMPELGFLGGADISISNVRLRYYTDAGGNLVRLATSMRMAVPAGILTITAPLSLEIEILAVGDDVTVTLPDNLGDFVLRD
ncbi:MAG: hypothetical protein FWB75_04205, partial [Oscillospiraceae bacterium]|nr:hypothetical protein [Oscillospiraceae bacterium]